MKKVSGILVVCMLLNLMSSICMAVSEPLPPIYFENWTVGFNNSANNYAEGSAEIVKDESEAHTGSRCIYLKYPLSKKSNRYMTLKSSTMTFDSNKKYKFGFWLKASKGSKGVAARIGWNSGRFNVLGNSALSEDTDWEYYEFICTSSPSGSQTLLFLIEDICADGIWLDDLEVSECDEDGNSIGENLLQNPGFESSIPPGEAQNIEVEYGVGSMSISWTNPTDADYKKAVIYQASDGQAQNVIAEVQNPLNTYTIQNLSDNTPYKYIIKTCDTAGDESEGTEISGVYRIPRPQAPEVKSDDKNNIIIGIDETMEYKIDDGEWIAYDPINPPKFLGDCIVSVRVAASGEIPSSEETLLTFTADYPNVLKDDFNNIIVGIDETMEYKINDGEWITYDSSSEPNLSGDCIVQIRCKSGETSGKIRTMTFTKNPEQSADNCITAQIEYNKGEITVKGVTPAGEGNAVTLMALSKGSNAREYKNIFELRQLISGENGAFDVRFTMPDIKDGKSTNGGYVIYIDGDNADKAIPPVEYFHRTAYDRQAAVKAVSECVNSEEIKNLLHKDSDLRPAIITIGVPIDEYDSLSEIGKSDFAKLIAERISSSTDEDGFKTAFEESAVIALLNDAENTGEVETVLADYKKMLDLKYNSEITYETLIANKEIKKLNWIFERILNKKGFNTVGDVQSIFKEGYALYILNNASYGEMENVMSANAELLKFSANSAYKKYLSLPAYSNDSRNKANKVSVNKELVRILNNSPVTEASGFISALEKAVGEAKNVIANNNSGGGGGGGSSTGKGSVYTIPDAAAADEAETSFMDISGVPWARESIESLTKQGIISGYPGNIFMPDANVTREEFVKMLVIGLGLYDSDAQCGFDDVTPDKWYYSYVASANKSGIAEGIDSRNFGAGMQITREQMAALIYRAAKHLKIELKQIAEPVEFDDAKDISDYAKESILAMQAAGIINGTGDNKYAPKDTASRAQAAKVIYELLKSKP